MGTSSSIKAVDEKLFGIIGPGRVRRIPAA